MGSPLIGCDLPPTYAPHYPAATSPSIGQKAAGVLLATGVLLSDMTALVAIHAIAGSPFAMGALFIVSRLDSKNPSNKPIQKVALYALALFAAGVVASSMLHLTSLALTCKVMALTLGYASALAMLAKNACNRYENSYLKA